ncbi:uncharacterized protein B0I36DRAFT_311727 [Microdochium trichocladiopsis]|uniref:Uncharacterized protein n=1 Tax=Microdochium trichocladiopsis TaxID=1682393 RepID=A0A9P9BWL1_9PEZI|nr:uncharacterized protein B0I36DRAFT_311727 [Microdochium trichocladiopsis]KAH7040902.1 hypothetical protein B0I36DRAFT_311727 [Microdochium trichocladiopsis]
MYISPEYPKPQAPLLAQTTQICTTTSSQKRKMHTITLRSATALITTFFALFPGPAQANFDIYRTQIYWGNRPSISWQFWEAEAPNDCNKLIAQGLRDDISGKDPLDVLWSVSCQGSGCAESTPPGDIDVLKLKLSPNPLLYWTLYKDRNWSMIGQDGNSYGDCMVFPHGDVDCWYGPYHIRSRRKFRCLTRFTADNINKGTMPSKRAEIEGEPQGQEQEQRGRSLTFEELIAKQFGTSPSGLVPKAYTA